MELLPRALVAGVVMPPTAPGQPPQVNIDRINRLWSELAASHGFTQLQMNAEQTEAEFVGATPDDGFVIKPPLLQFRRQIAQTAAVAADEAQVILTAVARQLGITQYFNFGVRHVYTAPLDTNDARAFVMRNLLGGDDLAGLSSEEERMWGGVKYVVQQPHGGGGEAMYTLTIEPLQADEMKSLYIDLDAQFPGPFNAADITLRAGEALQFLQGPVIQYLERFHR